jgi:hypothetical protein
MFYILPVARHRKDQLAQHSGKTLLAQSDSAPAMLCRVDLETGKCKPWKQIGSLDLAYVGEIWPAVLP